MRRMCFWVACLTLTVTTLEAQTQVDAPRYEKIIRTMVSDLKLLVSQREASDLVHLAVAALDRSEATKVPHVVNPDRKGVLAGMSLNYRSEDSWYGLSFGPEFLDTYWTGSTAHLCVLVHELWHLRDYLADAESFTSGTNDPKEKFWYELDAMHVEADFVKDYLDPARLSRFEDFVLQSYQGDNLNSLATILQHESASLFFDFNALENAYRSGQKTGAVAIAEMLVRGKDILDRYDQAPVESGFPQYFAYVEAWTFKNYMLRTLPLFLNSPLTTWGQVFKDYPDVQLIYDRVGEIEKRTRDTQSQYLQNLTAWWEKDLLARRDVP